MILILFLSEEKFKTFKTEKVCIKSPILISLILLELCIKVYPCS